MKTAIIISAVLNALLLTNPSAAMAQCEGNQLELDAIKEKYQSRFKLVEERANKINEDAPNPDNAGEVMLGVDFDIEMKEQNFALDVVSVTMKDEKMSLDLPQVTMELKSIKFDEFYTKMVLKKTGQYPQVHCKTTWIYGPFGSKTKGVPKCKTVWKDILTKVPEVHKRTVEIKTELPSFKMERTEFITAIPEFKMVRQDVKMHLPSIVVKNIKAETKKLQEDSEQLQNDSQDLVADQKKEFADAITKNFQCQRENLLAQREELSSSFSNSIKEIDANIEQLKSNGFDPSNLKASDGTTINLMALKAQLAEKEQEALTSIDAALTQINEKERETMDTYFKDEIANR